MQMQINFTEDALQCFTCKNPLSYFPIYLCSNNENVCGRCTIPAKSHVRNIAYESISQFLQFPCRYKNQGCIEQIAPKDVEEHEKNCPCRTINCLCAKINKCDWKGPCYNLVEHCRNDHSEIILQNGEFELNLTSVDETINFIEHDNKLYIVILKVNLADKILQCAICDFESENNVDNYYYCQLKIENCEENTLEKFQITAFNDPKFTNVYFSNDNLLNGRVIIEKNQEDGTSNADMLNLLKCYICSEYAVPPVYQCSKNHSTVCSECKQQHSAQCDCWIQFGKEIRNISLDNIARMLNYSCKNQQRGCFYTSKPDNIKTHQQSCRYQEFKCPVHEFINCRWRGLGNEMVTHIAESHRDLIQANSSDFSGYLVSKQTYCNLIQFANRWFRLVFIESDKRFYWSVQMIGRFENNFRYEIELFDKNCNGRFIVGNSVSPLVSKNQLFQDNNSYCYLHADQISWLMPKPNTLAFKVNIRNYVTSL